MRHSLFFSLLLLLIPGIFLSQKGNSKQNLIVVHIETSGKSSHAIQTKDLLLSFFKWKLFGKRRIIEC